MEQHSLQVGTQFYRNSIYNSLIELKEKEELPLEIHEYQQGKRYLLDCRFELSLNNKGENKQTLRKIHSYYFANAIAETIVKNWEKDHIRWHLKNKYKFKNSELEIVYNKVIDYLTDNLNYRRGYMINRKTFLVNQILTCIESQNSFDIEGFLRFRAQEYKKELEKGIKYVVDEYIIEKEYIEFIELLKGFVDSQRPRLYTLHVGITHKGKFNLYNEVGEKITRQFMDDIVFMDGNNELTYEDLLISALIAVAPRQIILHICYDGYRDTLQTIFKVFEGRVSYCSGECSICQKIDKG